MSETDTWPTLTAAIQACRAARDRSASAAPRARALGLPTLSDDFDELAATYDRLLANLLRLQRQFPDGL